MTRQADPKDRRKVIVAVVQEQVEAVAAMYLPTVMKIYNLYAGYSEKELSFLMHFCQNMERIYQEGIDQARSNKGKNWIFHFIPAFG